MEIKWHEWCRLCARGNSGSQNIDLNTVSDGASVSTAIGKYFWVNIRSSDPSKYVCHDCYMLVNLLVNFTERINKVQAMFLMLQNAKPGQLDPYEVRSQFDLLDEDWEHIIKSEGKPFNNFDYNPENITLEDVNMETSHYQNKAKGNPSVQQEADSNAHIDYDWDSDEGVNERELKNVKTKIKDESILKSTEIIEESANQEDRYEDENLEEEIPQKNEVSYEYKENLEEESHTNIKDKDVDLIENDDQDELPVKQRPSISGNEQTITISKDPADNVVLELNRSKYQCKSCGKMYKNAMSYRKHLESHNLESDLPDFMCEECGKVLGTERQLLHHKRTHLPLEEKLNVECPHCHKKYINEAVVKQHIIHMHTEQSFVCEECGMTLKRLASLKEHKLTHTNILAFTCESCNKGFKNKARLKAHMDAVHSNTTYQCSECDLKLNSKRTLKMHMLVHTNVKGYKCNFCGAEFKRGKSLKNHLIIHIGLRPYECNFCEKTFTNGSNCRAHKKKIHPLELEAEEAAGLKNKGTVVPNLYELQARESVQEPRSSNRTRGGITPKMRALLVAAEQLGSSVPNRANKRDKHFKFDSESSEFQEVVQLEVENNVDCFEQDETLVIEIVEDGNL